MGREDVFFRIGYGPALQHQPGAQCYYRFLFAHTVKVLLHSIAKDGVIHGLQYQSRVKLLENPTLALQDIYTGLQHILDGDHVVTPDDNPSAASERLVNGGLQAGQVEECGAAHVQLGRLEKRPNPTPVDLGVVRVVL